MSLHPAGERMLVSCLKHPGETIDGQTPGRISFLNSTLVLVCVTRLLVTYLASIVNWATRLLDTP